jgi:DNA-binding response OmpR family regulator
VPVIVVTALSFEEAEEIARAGVDDFVTKPFDPQQLVAKIRYHLDRLRDPAAAPIASPMTHALVRPGVP